MSVVAVLYLVPEIDVDVHEGVLMWKQWNGSEPSREPGSPRLNAEYICVRDFTTKGGRHGIDTERPIAHS